MLVGGNVRRLMYQSLIFVVILLDDARRLRPALDREDVERLADALVDGVRRNPELGGDLFGIEVLGDEPQAIELTACQASDARRHRIVRHL
jgi:hypothetical protein